MKKTLILLVALMFAVPLQTNADPPTPEQKRITGIERAMQSTVKLAVTGATGSGFYIAPHYVLTNTHVVMAPGMDGINVTRSDGTACRGELDYRDEALDLALVKVDCTGEPLTLANGVRLGQDVYLSGNPKSLDWIVTTGIVSRIMEQPHYTAIIADIDAEPGNSGGPMVDSDGKVIGVAYARNKVDTFLTFAIHVKDVESFLNRSGVMRNVRTREKYIPIPGTGREVKSSTSTDA